MVYTLRFFPSKCSLLHNSNVFGSCIIHILYTGCAKIKKIIIPAPKGQRKGRGWCGGEYESWSIELCRVHYPWRFCYLVAENYLHLLRLHLRVMSYAVFHIPIILNILLFLLSLTLPPLSLTSRSLSYYFLYFSFFVLIAVQNTHECQIV